MAPSFNPSTYFLDHAALSSLDLAKSHFSEVSQLNHLSTDTYRGTPCLTIKEKPSLNKKFIYIYLSLFVKAHEARDIRRSS